ncbi:MAG TPA: preprotein translocase subunit SecE [Tepidisphaeraceae bacterium]
MANEAADAGDSGAYHPPQPKAVKEPGFFTLYKSGQGYWTRMGTVFGAVLIGGLTAQFMYVQVQSHSTDKIALISTSIFVAAYGLLCFWLLNKPTTADFLIATDSEMKKVNWTSRKELIGSTKVVIVFMFIIAALLFGIDVFFGYIFYFINVLKTRPF